jgi:putative ABC transport system permease protein
MLADVAAETLRSLRAHRLRYGLTSSGIVWGILMLTFLSASMDGYDLHFAHEMTKIGRKVVFLFPGSVTRPGVGQLATRAVDLELEDVARVAALDSVESAGTNRFLGSLLMRAGPRTKLIWSYGATADTLSIRSFEVATGRGFHAHDVAASARVVFLAPAAAERLFGAGRPAVGRTVRIDGIPFRVIGVARPKGEQIIFNGPPDDDIAFVPVTTAQRWFNRDDGIGQMIFAPRTREQGFDAVTAVRGLLGLHHDFGPDDDSALASFYVVEALQIVELLLLGLRIFLTTAIVITLLVGAAGVMNVMYVVVTERTREIGLRKAIGASNRAIFLQFLAEAFAVTVISGLVGAALGWLAVTAAAAGIGEGSTMASAPVLMPRAFVAIVLTMVVVGVAAGLLPALRASRIDPAVSLRAT